MLKSFKSVGLGLVLGMSVGSAFAADIAGAGASFPYPVYAKWADAYHKATGNRMNYQSIGSGGGIRQIKAKTVDFGASDAPLTPDELAEAGLMQWPMVMGGVVPVVNLDGIGAGELKLSNDVLADLFLGKITSWDDEAIAALNPGVDLPSRRVTAVYRSDGSGTTFVFTDYLGKVSEEWKREVGVGKAVAWPTGVSGKGNEGVASYVGRIKGGIGYVEYAYALQNELPHVQLRNQAGQWVNPGSESFQAAAAGADWEQAEGMYLVLTNQPGAKSWPITAATYILMHKQQDKPEAARNALDFFSWAFENGDEMADELHYVAMPDSVVKFIEQRWKNELTDTSGQPVLR
ncbi:phosphate ABC transporter substrate-binding protein PstS [Alkalilimnicola sp. S0819]|uniref:phosphate ABC transporter substrate-binding protein PstS n=1 Tax=Alkalilimnicola sp. S0819 TaxID=2613922 RepID=UPI001262559E|nr:phosphate ABC transporter substrate-binding protein PstS [Alkalilimnicola sp. S0819]KAB7623177.1 phosphate ABC transporter substrate-binding protein PstS [Alkalilimnicola sp. S0819]MPQ17021.1 phosphate ABC transporter substrate-binding protein PstS [Alkalilimnicola sp. S0819]